MRYPTITWSDCRELADRKSQGDDPAIAPYVHPQGVGQAIDLKAMEEAATKVRSLLYQHHDTYAGDRDRLEGRAAPILYEAVQHADITVLDDPGFWRYLSLAHFWRFIVWREDKAFERGNHLRYVDGRNSTECVLTRMYIRMRALGGSGYGDLAWALPKAADFWRSHIIRVRTGTAPAVTRAFVRKYQEDRLSTQDLRDFAKRLNRTWTNIVLNTYDDEGAQQLIAELWHR